MKYQLPPENVVHPHGLRLENLPYLAIWVLYYAWIGIFASWWLGSPLRDTAFDQQIRNLMHITILLSSALFVFLIRRQWFAKAARIGALLIFAGLIAFYISVNPQIRIIAATVSAVAMGCVNICILIPFVFTLNNTEKLYAVVASNLLIQFTAIFRENNLFIWTEPLLSGALLLSSLLMILFFRPQTDETATENEDSTPPETQSVMNSRIYLSLLFNCAIAILCKGVGKGILNALPSGINIGILTGYYFGGILGCVFYLLIYAYAKKAYIWLGNITFSSVTIGLMCNAFSQQLPQLALPFAVLLGLGSTVGMINMYYILGVIGKKYNSLRYIKLFIFSIGIGGGISGIVLGNLISRIGTMQVSVYASILSAVVMIAFMFVSPLMERAEYVNDWGRDSAYTDVSGDQLALFKPYGLSKREAEVCDLLLRGYTLRQISAILPIAYSTVNTYYNSAYRKLGINSRAELLLMFKDYLTE